MHDNLARLGAVQEARNAGFYGCAGFHKLRLLAAKPSVLALFAMRCGNFGLERRNARFRHAGRNVHENCNTSSIAVGTIVICTGAGKNHEQQVDGCKQNRQARYHVDDDKANAAEADKTADQVDNRKRHHTAQSQPLKLGKKGEQRPADVLANLAAVVMGNEDDLAAASRTRRLRGFGNVLRHNILAYALVEEARENRAVKRLSSKKQSGDQGEDQRRNGHERNDHRNNCHEHGDAAANGHGKIVVGIAVEVLDNGWNTSLLVQGVGDVKSSLLLFLGTCRTRAYGLRQIFNVIANFGHSSCLSSTQF